MDASEKRIPFGSSRGVLKFEGELREFVKGILWRNHFENLTLT